MRLYVFPLTLFASWISNKMVYFTHLKVFLFLQHHKHSSFVPLGLGALLLSSHQDIDKLVIGFLADLQVASGSRLRSNAAL